MTKHEMFELKDSSKYMCISWIQPPRFIVLTATQNIGHLSLFVDVLTNFVVTALIGLSKRHPGGKTCKETCILYHFLLITATQSWACLINLKMEGYAHIKAPSSE